MSIARYFTLPRGKLIAPIMTLSLLLAGAASGQGITLSVQLAPPVLPVYDQPPMPDDGYLWTPGYWGWSPAVGYYWVPGTWVEPPEAGMLWTPPYWGWGEGAYQFHAGYWGQHVGYYGGVNYGYGYGGSGYQGGRWQENRFVYNSSTNNFGAVRVHNSYRERPEQGDRNRTSYAGGDHGLRQQPNESQRSVERENHLPVTADQARHDNSAAAHPGLAASHENGRPVIAATQRPAQFEGPVVTQPRPYAQRPSPVPAAAPQQRQAPAAAPQQQQQQQQQRQAPPPQQQRQAPPAQQQRGPEQHEQHDQHREEHRS